ncbi:MAG: F0F1 ATP synthase subunit alpha [Xanthomonadales bacterium]|jgi:F-type H+-transporting ATPase subunit alpha|nr:F0F1 ATP synthase subunit alpha [Xanthomonadales bacterium]
MSSLTAELRARLDRAERVLDTRRAATEQSAYQRVGRVTHIGDGVARVEGLADTRLDELLRFADGSLGLALKIDEHEIHVALLEHGRIGAGSPVQGTGRVIRVPVGPALLGRVLDPLGNPLDEGPPVVAERHDPVDRPAPAIVDRELVTEPLSTGVTVVDAMIPLGRGQRELIIGDRKTGKSALALDAVIRQKHSDVVCVWVSIGQKASTVQRVIDAVREHGAPERCLFVVAAAESPAAAQWLAPYAACTMAEYFRDRGQHALLVIDELSTHAVVYRQMSLLLRQPPGREAYPGDVFHLHARLLERAAKLHARLGGGSLTALPIAETQGGDLSGYIPTNLISITDGQIYLETRAFYAGQKPPVNAGLSVSRVGAQTQAPAMKALAGPLRLAYAQFQELEVFTRFGALIDERTRKAIQRGRAIRAVLAQPELQPLAPAAQVALLLAVTEGLLDGLASARIVELQARLPAALAAQCPGIADRLDRNGPLLAADRDELLARVGALIG